MLCYRNCVIYELRFSLRGWYILGICVKLYVIFIYMYFLCFCIFSDLLYILIVSLVDLRSLGNWL